MTSAGGTSLASSSACRGLAPPLPPTKILNPFSVAIRPKLSREGYVRHVRMTSTACANLQRGRDKTRNREKGNVLFALCLGALPNTPAHAALELVWTPDALVALLQPYRHADAVADAESAPRGAHAALDGPQRLGVGVTTLHAGIYETPPDVQKVLLPGTKHVDPLASRDLCIQSVVPSDLAHDDQFVGRDLAARYARHDAECAVALDVPQEAVVRVLQAVVRAVHNVPVPKGGEDTGDGGLAHLAA